MKKTIVITIWIFLLVSSLGFLLYGFDQQIEASRNKIEAIRLYELNQASKEKIRQLEMEKDSLLIVIKEFDSH